MLEQLLEALCFVRGELRHCGIHTIFSHILPIHHLQLGTLTKQAHGIKGWDICVLYAKTLKTPVKFHNPLDKFDMSIKSLSTSQSVCLFVCFQAFVSFISSELEYFFLFLDLLNVVYCSWVKNNRRQ